MYQMFGLIYASLLYAGSNLRTRLSSERGQGTVEYVSLILVIALVMGGIVLALHGFKSDAGKAIADSILKQLKKGVDSIDF